MSGSIGTKSRTPWFANSSPWPWWRAGPKQTIASGQPQHLLHGPVARTYGFNVDVHATLSGNVSGATAGNFPATQGSVFNASAAQIASAPAFASHNRYD